MKNYVRGILVMISLVLSSTNCWLYGADCPIIFTHGQMGTGISNDEVYPIDCWPDWNGKVYSKPYRTAMDRILEQHYGGYSAGYLTNGDSIDCHVNSSLASSVGNTKKIYNFSYYNPDGSRGAIGGRSDIIACGNGPNGEDEEYVTNIETAQWSGHLVEFIEKVLEACYGDQWPDNPNAKVDIVAHCMGGLVARAAIKWRNFTYYGYSGMVRDRVRKLLLIATPNKGCDFTTAPAITEVIMGHSNWQVHGEDLEMNVDPVMQDKDWRIE